jgi:NAD(P)-dependent dehydrogenase (short-subunit alcohol dehydrogenase family)
MFHINGMHLIYSRGPIDTPMHRAAAEKSSDGDQVALNWQIKRVGRAEEVAALIAWLLCPMSTYITGTVQTIDGGWTC